MKFLRQLTFRILRTFYFYHFPLNPLELLWCFYTLSDRFCDTMVLSHLLGQVLRHHGALTPCRTGAVTPYRTSVMIPYCVCVYESLRLYVFDHCDLVCRPTEMLCIILESADQVEKITFLSLVSSKGSFILLKWGFHKICQNIALFLDTLTARRQCLTTKLWCCFYEALVSFK